MNKNQQVPTDPQFTSPPFTGYPVNPGFYGHSYYPFNGYAHTSPHYPLVPPGGHHYNHHYPQNHYLNPFLTPYTPYQFMDNCHSHYSKPHFMPYMPYNFINNDHGCCPQVSSPHYQSCIQPGFNYFCSLPSSNLVNKCACPPRESSCSCEAKVEKCSDHTRGFDYFYYIHMLQSLYAQIAYLQAELLKCNELVKQLKEENKQLKEEKTKLEEKIKELQDEIDKLKKALEEEASKTKDCSSIEKLLQDEQAKTKELASKLDDIKTKVKNSKASDELEQVKKDIESGKYNSPIPFEF